MATTFTLIDKTILTTTQTSVTFSAIPSTYTDLKLVFSVRATNYTGTFQNLGIRINGSGNTTGYSEFEVRGNGSAAASGGYTSTQFGLDRYPTQNATASTFGNGELYIPNYTSSNNKSMSTDSTMENNATESFAQLTAKLWSNTTAISSIYLFPVNGGGTDSFAVNSSFYLYGIKNS